MVRALDHSLHEFSLVSQGQKPSRTFLHGFYGWLALWPKGRHLTLVVCPLPTDRILVGCEVRGYGSHRSGMHMYTNYV